MHEELSPLARPRIVSEDGGKERKRPADCTADLLDRATGDAETGAATGEGRRRDQVIRVRDDRVLRRPRDEGRRGGSERSPGPEGDGKNVKPAKPSRQVTIFAAEGQRVVDEELPTDTHLGPALVVIERPSLARRAPSRGNPIDEDDGGALG